MQELNQSIQVLKGIGQKRYQKFSKKNILTIQDLINLFPSRYKDTTKIFSVSETYKLFYEKHPFLLMNNQGLTLTITGTIQKQSFLKTPRKKIFLLELTITDNNDNKNNKDSNPSEKIKIQFFNQPYLRTVFQDKKRYIFFGKVMPKNGRLFLNNPDFEEIENIKETKKFGKLIPVYKNISIKQGTIRQALFHSIEFMQKIPEFIPNSLKKEYKLINLNQAYINLHFPKTKQNIIDAYKRLQYQELLELFEIERQNSLKISANMSYIKFTDTQLHDINVILNQIAQLLPYKLSHDQEKALSQVLQSMKKDHKILLYGDVGSGKTIIFLLLAISLILNNFSAVLVAPTTILADQHYKNAKNLIKTLKLKDKVVIQKIDSSNSYDKNITINKPTLLIGTHALLYKNFNFKNNTLALLGIDEEQRFGTEQRESFSNLSNTKPIQLSLTATPIPKTLAQSVLGYNKLITIDSTPFSKQIKTILRPTSRINKILNWLKQELKKGNQSYFIFPRVKENKLYDMHSIEEWQETLQNQLQPYKIAVLHGQQSQNENQKIIKDFNDKKIHVLLSTSIVEVGIDNPNANTMLIFSPQAFGLAQLHQLRGRIGRRGQESYCILLHDPTLPETTLNKLQQFTKITNGIKLAQLDLELRGPGYIVGGPDQTGWNKLKIANINNYKMLKQAHELFRKLQPLQITVPIIITKSNKKLT